MKTQEAVIIGLLVMAPLAYPVLMRVTARLIQPKRLEMARLGMSIIARNDVPLPKRKMVKAMLTDAYDFRVALIMALAVPVFAVKILSDKIPLSEFMINRGESDPAYKKVCDLHSLSIAVANPFFFLLCVIGIVVLCLPAIAIKRVSSKTKIMTSGFASNFKASVVYANSVADDRLGYSSAQA